MKKLMQILFLSCLKATEFIERKLNYKLNWKEKLQLKVHTSMCKACSDYEKQSVVIEKLISESNVHNIDKKEVKKLKDSILERIG